MEGVTVIEVSLLLKSKLKLNVLFCKGYVIFLVNDFMMHC